MTDDREPFRDRSDLPQEPEHPWLRINTHPWLRDGAPVADDRSEMEAARLAGLAKRHEKRLENATYTAAEVKVLTAKARQDAAEEIAKACEALYIPVHNVGGAEPIPSDPTEWDEALHEAAVLARQIGSQPSPDATSGRTDREAK